MHSSRRPESVSVCGISRKKLTETMKLLSMDESYAERDLNVGFSGGEKKKSRDFTDAYVRAKACNP